MNFTKKAAALLLTLTIVFSCTAVDLTASALSIEDAVQFGLKIANDNKHGYSQSSRWGPDYDCSSFVLTCLKEAGFNTGNAVSTHSMKKELTRHGFKWYPWNTINGPANLKRGDVLLDEDYHTEFHIGRGQDLGAFQDYNHPESGDQTGSEISVCPYYSYNWDGVLRYTNDTPRVKPSDVELETYTTVCAVGDNIYFSLFSINAAEQYIVIKKDGKQVDKINVTDKYEYNHSFKNAGTYSCVLTAKNKLGQTTSSAKVIKVYKDKPSDVTLSSDKTACRVGGTVNFKFSSKNSEEQWLYFNDGYWGGDSVNVTGKKEYKKKFDEAGVYNVSLTAYNPIGSEYSKQRRIVVYDKAPYDMYISSDKYHYAVGDDVVLYLYGNGAAQQFIDIKIGGVKYKTIDASGEAEHTLKTEKGGKYSVTLTGKNEFGAATSSAMEFTVYDTKPDTPTIEARRYCDVNDNMYFEVNAENATETRIEIFDKTGNMIKSESLSTHDWFTYMFPRTGDYTYRLTAINPIGETSSALKNITVYNEPPKDLSIKSDAEFYILGDEVTFSIGGIYYDSASIDIRRNGYYEDYIYLDNKTEYTYKPENCGVYTYTLNASNSYGSKETEQGTFIVYDSIPYDLNIELDKPAYAVGQPVKFTLGGEYAIERTLYITSNDGKLQKISVGSADNYEHTFEKVGVYTCTLSARNEFGEAFSQEKSFTVYDDKPSQLNAYTDRSKYQPYNKVKIKLESNDAEKQHLTVSCNGRSVVDTDVTGMDEYELYPDDTGLYLYIFSAKNQFGEETLLPKTFKVSDSVTISFDPNGGTNAPEEQTVYNGYGTWLDYSIPTREGYDFIGWSTDPTLPAPQYTPSDYLVVNEDITLFALWKPNNTPYSDYSFSHWIWNDDATASAVFTKNEYNNDVSENFTESVDTPDTPDTPDSPDTPDDHFSIPAKVEKNTNKQPTCTENGEITYFASVILYGNTYSDEKTVQTSPIGHAYRLTKWEWDGKQKATPYFNCANDPSHEIVSKSTITREVLKSEYKVRYTASAEFEGKTYTSEKIVNAYSVGDIDSDRNITSTDALAILRLSVGMGSNQLPRSLYDIDGDTNVTSADALIVLRQSIGFSTKSHIGEIVD